MDNYVPIFIAQPIFITHPSYNGYLLRGGTSLAIPMVCLHYTERSPFPDEENQMMAELLDRQITDQERNPEK